MLYGEKEKKFWKKQKIDGKNALTKKKIEYPNVGVAAMLGTLNLYLYIFKQIKL